MTDYNLGKPFFKRMAISRETVVQTLQKSILILLLFGKGERLLSPNQLQYSWVKIASVPCHLLI